MAELDEKREKWNKYVKQAWDFMALRDYRGAIAEYTKAIELAPEYLNTYHYRGNCYNIIGLRREAIMDFTFCWENNFKPEEMIFCMAIAYRGLGDLDVVIELLTEVIRHHPSIGKYYYERGRTNMQQRLYDKALADFDRAINLDPPSIIISRFVDLCRSEVKIGNQETRIKEAQKINEEAYQEYIKGDNYSQAIKLYLQVNELDPMYIKALVHLGSAYFRIDEYEKAIECFIKILDIYYVDIVARINLSNCFFRLHRYHESLDEANFALQINPNLGRGYSNRGKVYAVWGESEKAVIEFNRSIEIDPTEFIGYFHRGKEFAKFDKHPEAIADFTKVIENGNPSTEFYRAEYYEERGNSYQQLENFNSALKDYDKAIELNPKSDRAFFFRGVTYYLIDQSQKAIEDLTQALVLRPNIAITYFYRGLTYFEAKNYSQAIADLKQAVKLDPQTLKYQEALKEVESEFP